MATTVSIVEHGKFGFLNLPAEIRVQIYSSLFQGSKLSCDTPHISIPSCGFSTCTCLFPRQLANTCQLLREESLSYLMASTTLEVAGTLEKIAKMPERYLSSITRAIVLDAKPFSLRPFQLELLPALQVLELRSITCWCKYYDEVFLFSKFADDTMVDMSLFNLRRIGANLHELCYSPRSFRIHLCCQFVVNSLSDETVVSD